MVQADGLAGLGADRRRGERLAGWLAELAVGRWQDYQLYGIARPVADLLLIIGAVWLVVTVISVARKR